MKLQLVPPETGDEVLPPRWWANVVVKNLYGFGVIGSTLYAIRFELSGIRLSLIAHTPFGAPAFEITKWDVEMLA